MMGTPAKQTGVQDADARDGTRPGAARAQVLPEGVGSQAKVRRFRQSAAEPDGGNRANGKVEDSVVRDQWSVPSPPAAAGGWAKPWRDSIAPPSTCPQEAPARPP